VYSGAFVTPRRRAERRGDVHSLRKSVSTADFLLNKQQNRRSAGRFGTFDAPFDSKLVRAERAARRTEGPSESTR